MKLITNIEVETKYSDEEIEDFKALSDEKVTEFFASWRKGITEMINENFDGEVSVKVSFDLKEAAE